MSEIYGVNPVTIESNAEKLRDEIATIAFTQVLMEIRQEQLEPNLDFMAKRVWDLTDAFMRERYERNCVKAAGINVDKIK